MPLAQPGKDREFLGRKHFPIVGAPLVFGILATGAWLVVPCLYPEGVALHSPGSRSAPWERTHPGLYPEGVVQPLRGRAGWLNLAPGCAARPWAVECNPFGVKTGHHRQAPVAKMPKTRGTTLPDSRSGLSGSRPGQVHRRVGKDNPHRSPKTNFPPARRSGDRRPTPVANSGKRSILSLPRKSHEPGWQRI